MKISKPANNNKKASNIATNYKPKNHTASQLTQPGSCYDTSARILLKKDQVSQLPGFITKSKDGSIFIPGGIVDFGMTMVYERPDLIKCSEKGDIIWARQINTDYPGACYYNQVLESADGSIYAQGQLSIPADSVQGNHTEMIVAKLDKHGNILWNKTFRSSEFSKDYGSLIDVYQVTEDKNGNIYFTGTLRNNLPGGAIVIKMDKNGSILWSKHFTFSNIITYGYGISFIGPDIMLYGKTDYGYYNDASFLIRLNQVTGETISTKAYAPVGPNAQFATWSNHVYVTVLNNGNVALAGRLFNDGFLNSNGTTRYSGMIEFTPEGSFVKGYQVTGTYLTNGYNTRITVHADQTADFSFLNWDNSISGLKIIYGNIQGNHVAKQRVINIPFAGASPAYNFLKLSDGGSVGVGQHVDETGYSKLELMRLHNSDLPGICVGMDTSMVNIIDLDYGPVELSPFTEKTDVATETFRTEFTSTEELITTASNCSQTSFCDALKLYADKNSICAGNPINFTYAKNKECGTKLLWQFNESIVDEPVITDSSLTLKFNKQWQGYVYGILPGCSFVADSVYIKVSAPLQKPDLGKDSFLCSNGSYMLHATNQYVWYKWQDGSTDSVYNVQQPGKYYVTVKDHCGATNSDTVNISAALAKPLNFASLYTKCNADSINVSVPLYSNYNFIPAGNIQYKNGAIIAWPSANTNYFVQAVSEQGCTITDSLQVQVNTSQKFSLGEDTTFCAGNTLTLQAPDGFIEYTWNDGASSTTLPANATGTYWLKTVDHHQCTFADSVIITVYDLPEVNLGNDTTICPDSYFTLNAGNHQASYLWQDGSVNSTFKANKPGTYWVALNDQNGCINTDSLVVTGYKNLPSGFLNDTDSVCVYEPAKISALGNWASYLWNTGAEQSFINVTTPGFYWLTVSNSDGCYTTDTIRVFKRDCINGIYFPTAFTPNRDGKNDLFKPIVHVQLEKYYFAVYNRFGQKVFETRDINKGWNGIMQAMLPIPAATFAWFCSYKLPGQPEKTEKGTVVLLP